MSIDMYGEAVASASALIREFAKTEYYHYFAINMEASLEAFIAMMDSCREEGRVKGRGEALAELHPAWLAEKERADQLQAQLEEAETLIAHTSHDAAERISELEAQFAELTANVEWMTIQDTLPEKGQLVWCARKDGRVHLARRKSDLPVASREPWQDCYWWDDETGSNWSDVTVLAWTPVPERIRPAAPSTVEG